MILFDIYEPKVTKTLLSLINEDDIIVVDAGAWIGYYTCLAAIRASKVIAIELHPANITKRNIALDGFKNVNRGLHK